MANLDLKHKINVPFADKGNRDNIPDTSPDGLVNNTDGFGVKYELEIPEGGEYFERQAFNGILYKVYAAVKELQDLAISACRHDKSIKCAEFRAWRVGCKYCCWRA